MVELFSPTPCSGQPPIPDGGVLQLSRLLQTGPGGDGLPGPGTVSPLSTDGPVSGCQCEVGFLYRLITYILEKNKI